MASEEFSDKLEDIIIGIVRYSLRFARSIWSLIVRPRDLLDAVQKDFSEARFLAPHAFLLSCALSLGLLGEILAEGFDRVSFATFERIKDISLWSFLNHSIPVFVIAFVAAVSVESLFREQDEQKRRHFKYVNFYVIGFFGLGSIIVLLLLSGFMRLTFDDFGQGTDIFIIVSSVAITGYVISMLALLYWLTSAALRRNPEEVLPKKIMARILFTNVVIVALCAFNFVSPLYQQNEGAPLLNGRLVDLFERPDGSLQITFLVTNASAADIVINQLDEVTIAAVSSDGSGEKETDYFCSKGVPTSAKQDFLIVAAEKSSLLAFCTARTRLLNFIKRANYGPIEREIGGGRLHSLKGQKLQFIARFRIAIGDRRDGEISVNL
jgi:hypothetical protein